MTQQQAQQQTQENNLLDLEETEAVNKEDTNKKNTEEEKLKEVSVLVNSSCDKKRENKLEKFLDRIYNSKFLDSCCKWLSKKVCKKAKDTTWLKLIVYILIVISTIDLFSYPSANFFKVIQDFFGISQEGWSVTLSLIRMLIIFVITTLTIYATSKIKSNRKILYAYCVELLFPIFLLVIFIFFKLDWVTLSFFIRSADLVLLVMSIQVSTLTIDEDYSKLKENEVSEFEDK